MFVGPRVVLRDAVTRARNVSPEGIAPKEQAALLALAERDGDKVNSQVFDMAMQLSGSYGIPFAVLREVVGARDAFVLFPLFVHFALKTMRPVHYFERFVAEVTPTALVRAEALGIAASWDKAAAAALYLSVLPYCDEIIRQAGDERLLQSAIIFQDSSLRENLAYRWAFGQVDRLATAMGELNNIVDMAICLPAFSDFREMLAISLAPPCVRFRDHQTVALAARYLSVHANASAEDSMDSEAAMSACLSLQQRWESFGNATFSSPIQ